MIALAGLLSLALTRGAASRDPEADAALDAAARGLARLDHDDAARIMAKPSRRRRAGCTASTPT